MESQSFVSVVVAEDEELILNNLVKKIEAADPRLRIVHAAQDGKSALDFVRDRQADVVVTDIRMPVMDGIELIKALHLHFPHIRKIIVSGHADFEYARKALRFDVNEYLLKPVKANELRSALSQIVASIEGERARLCGQGKGLPAQADRSEAIVQLVQHYLRENFTRDVSLEEIARHYNFTSSYLSKIFIKHTGESPLKYVIALRINEAKYLLAHQRSLSVKEVGERVGYDDQFYFSRIFKQVTGMTPKEFQK